MEEREGAKLWPFEPAQEGERERERGGRPNVVVVDLSGCIWLCMGW